MLFIYRCLRNYCLFLSCFFTCEFLNVSYNINLLFRLYSWRRYQEWHGIEQWCLSSMVNNLQGITNLDTQEFIFTLSSSRSYLLTFDPAKESLITKMRLHFDYGSVSLISHFVWTVQDNFPTLTFRAIPLLMPLKLRGYLCLRERRTFSSYFIKLPDWNCVLAAFENLIVCNLIEAVLYLII